MNTPPDLDETWMKFIGRYIGCLAVTYYMLDANGNNTGDPLTNTYSGFFIKLADQWFFVVAGHVFKRSSNDKKVGLEQAIARKAIRIVSAAILDYFGDNAKVFSATAIDYESVLNKTVFVNDDEYGLDFAFLPLREWYVASVTGNGVVPFVEDNWKYEDDAQQYRIIGFPEELQIPCVCTDSKILGYVRPVFAVLSKCNVPARFKRKIARFAGKLPDEGPKHAIGFSGSPVIALNANNGKTDIYLVGIEVEWDEDERTVIVCLMKDVVEAYRRVLAYFSSIADKKADEGP